MTPQGVIWCFDKKHANVFQTNDFQGRPSLTFLQKDDRMVRIDVQAFLQNDGPSAIERREPVLIIQNGSFGPIEVLCDVFALNRTLGGIGSGRSGILVPDVLLFSYSTCLCTAHCSYNLSEHTGLVAPFCHHQFCGTAEPVSFTTPTHCSESIQLLGNIDTSIIWWSEKKT